MTSGPVVGADRMLEAAVLLHFVTLGRFDYFEQLFGRLHRQLGLECGGGRRGEGRRGMFALNLEQEAVVFWRLLAV